jgi:hypothetical protein
LINIPEPFSFFSELGKVFIDLCSVYFTGVIFYFLTSHIPQCNRTIQIHTFCSNRFASINREISSLFSTIERYSALKSKGAIESQLAGINPNISINSKFERHPEIFQSWYDYFERKSEKIIFEIKNVLHYHELIEPNIIRYLANLEDNFYNLLWLIRTQASNQNLSYLSHYFEEVYKNHELFKKYESRYFKLVQKLHHWNYIKDVAELEKISET